MRLYVGDIVLGRPGGLLGHAVVKFQSMFGDPAEFSHVGIVSKDGDTLAARPAQPYVTEALARVETEPWEKNWAGRSFAIYRYRYVDSHARDTVRQIAAAFTGQRYGWFWLLVIAADAWVSRKRGQDTRWLSRWIPGDGAKRPFCSMLVQHVTRAAWAEDFGVPMGCAQPDDIGDHCAERGDLFELVWDTDLDPAVVTAAAARQKEA